ncbi:MAG: ABC transporter substrate-binding protein [Cellulosilyticaceae bacterium]
MNKRMKGLALMLVAMMSVGSLAGCGGAKAPATTGTPEGTKAPEQAAEKSAEPVNLVWWTIGTEPKDLKMVNDKINEYTKEKLNVTLDIKYVGWGEYGQKLSNVVQSGEPYDIAFGASINNYIDLANKGYFADLKDVVPKVAPKLNEFIPQDLWKAMTINKQVFGVPVYKDSAESHYWVYDKELVEKLGIDIEKINTLPELEPALKKIKENDPSKYPLILQGLEGINGFMATINEIDCFTNKPYVGVKFKDASAKVISPWEDAGVMDNLKIVHKWFKEGLINQDAATLTETPKYRPIFSAQGYPHADADWTVTSGYPVISHMFFGPGYSTQTIQGSFLVVSAGSKHIEEAAKVLELFNTDSTARNLLAFGIEGTHYEKTGENNIKILNDGYQAPAYSQATFFNMYAVDPAPATKWTDLKEHTSKAFSSPALGFTFNTQNVQNQVAACTNIQAKYEPALLTGTVNPEEAIPKMLDELNAAGYQDIIKEAQTQLDAFLGK